MALEPWSEEPVVWLGPLGSQEEPFQLTYSELVYNFGGYRFS